MYKSWSPLFKNLTVEQAGELIKTIMAYQDGDEVSTSDQTV